jgi:hypothetical protein
MGLIGKMGKKSYIRFEEIYKNDGSYGSVRLGLIKRMFEKYNICRTIGDIYGNPLSIVFKKNTDLWDRVLKAIGRRNQYFIAESRTGMLLNQIIDHVYEQELCGNIKTLPATERILFVESFYDELAKEDMEKILEESKSVEAFKLAQLKELENLCTYANPYMYIAKVLGVPYEINKK